PCPCNGERQPPPSLEAGARRLSARGRLPAWLQARAGPCAAIRRSPSAQRRSRRLVPDVAPCGPPRPTGSVTEYQRGRRCTGPLANARSLGSPAILGKALKVSSSLSDHFH